jgi:hypothetical protein
MCHVAPASNSPCQRSQTLRRDAALANHPKEQATRPRVRCGSKAPLTERPVLALSGPTLFNGSLGLQKSITTHPDGIDPLVTMHLALPARGMLTWVH